MDQVSENLWFGLRCWVSAQATLESINAKKSRKKTNQSHNDHGDVRTDYTLSHVYRRPVIISNRFGSHRNIYGACRISVAEIRTSGKLSSAYTTTSAFTNYGLLSSWTHIQHSHDSPRQSMNWYNATRAWNEHRLILQKITNLSPTDTLNN